MLVQNTLSWYNQNLVSVYSFIRDNILSYFPLLCLNGWWRMSVCLV